MEWIFLYAVTNMESKKVYMARFIMNAKKKKLLITLIITL